MPLFASLLVVLGLFCIVLATILLLIFRQPETSLFDLLAKGSFVYRNLENHIILKWVKPIYALTYGGLSFLLLAIFGLLIFNASSL